MSENLRRRIMMYNMGDTYEFRTLHNCYIEYNTGIIKPYPRYCISQPFFVNEGDCLFFKPTGQHFCYIARADNGNNLHIGDSLTIIAQTSSVVPAYVIYNVPQSGWYVIGAGDNDLNLCELMITRDLFYNNKLNSSYIDYNNLTIYGYHNYYISQPYKIITGQTIILFVSGTAIVCLGEAYDENNLHIGDRIKTKILWFTNKSDYTNYEYLIQNDGYYVFGSRIEANEYIYGHALLKTDIIYFE